MFTFIADTNLWLRFVDVDSAHHSVAVAALEEITTKARLHLVPQNLFEFWVVATRPKEANGLGWTTFEAKRRVESLRSRFQLKLDPSEITNEWLRLVHDHKIAGKKAHDARIIAALVVNEADYLVTFNIPDFLSWRIKVVHPANIPQLLASRS